MVNYSSDEAVLDSWTIPSLLLGGISTNSLKNMAQRYFTNKLRGQMVDFYNNNLRGTSETHPILGEINFTNIGIKKTKNTSADTRKLKAIPELPRLIRTGLYEGSKNPNKEKAKFNLYDYLINETQIDGKPFKHRITIGNDANGKHFYNINDIDYSPPFQE